MGGKDRLNEEQRTDCRLGGRRALLGIRLLPSLEGGTAMAALVARPALASLQALPFQVAYPLYSQHRCFF
jgi:hypothetical protein